MGTGSPILQSGNLTPGHLLQAVTDGVAEDAGVEFVNTQALYRSDVLGINFNSANTDTAIPINLPAGFTRWQASNVIISNPSGALNTATCGMFTATGGGGFAIVASGSAIAITTNAPNTANNAQNIALNGTGGVGFNVTVVYFRVQTPEGTNQTANVTVLYRPLP